MKKVRPPLRFEQTINGTRYAVEVTGYQPAVSPSGATPDTFDPGCGSEADRITLHKLEPVEDQAADALLEDDKVLDAVMEAADQAFADQEDRAHAERAQKSALKLEDKIRKLCKSMGISDEQAEILCETVRDAVEVP